MHATQNSSIKNQNNLQTWTRSVHRRLTVKTKPKENKDDDIPDMKINFDAIHITTDIPNYMTIQEIQQVMTKDDHLQELREHITRSCFQSGNEVLQEIRSYWTFIDDMAVIDCLILKADEL